MLLVELFGKSSGFFCLNVWGWGFFSPWRDIKDSAQILGTCMFLLFDDGSQQVLIFV